MMLLQCVEQILLLLIHLLLLRKRRKLELRVGNPRDLSTKDQLRNQIVTGLDRATAGME